MSNKETGILARLAAASLERCLRKISGASGGLWQLGEISVFRGTIKGAVGRHDFRNPAAAVYINVEGGFPFTSLMFFDIADIPHISKCFLDESLAQAGSIAQFDEVMLLELGNIILNAVINYLQNALKKFAIPSVPMLLKGDSPAMAAGLGAYIDPRRSFRIISAAITVACDGRVSRGEMLAVIPEELAAELERG